MLRKIKKLCAILRCFFKDEDNLFLCLFEIKAYECLDECFKLGVGSTEELEDLIFHIKAYKEIPNIIRELKYPEFKDVSLNELVKKYKNRKMSLKEVEQYGNFLLEIEENRAVERDFIFEHAKTLTFGFRF